MGKHPRLSSSKEFDRIYKKGSSVANELLVLRFFKRKDDQQSKLGIITTRRIGAAILRNRARRLIREAYRKHADEVNDGYDLAIVPRRTIIGKKLCEVEEALLRLLGRAGLIKKRKT
ncbi:MAG: ribonuclease P protein component [Candidatus Subteraquimicrobiales bacterium]|nr:ribonuclease P protein component [Candidatus Subteraquimicrobiales bacterium]